MSGELKGGYALGMSRQDILDTYADSPQPPREWMLDEGWCGVGFGFAYDHKIKLDFCGANFGYSPCEMDPYQASGMPSLFYATPDTEVLREIYGDRLMFETESTTGAKPRLPAVALPIGDDASMSIHRLQTGDYVLHWCRETEERATTIRLSADAAQATLRALQQVLE